MYFLRLSLLMQKTLFITILIIAFSLAAEAQEKANVIGKITNESGNPLELVNIAILDLPGGSTTDRNGNFKLEVPADKSITLIVSHIGYQSQQIEIILEDNITEEVNFILIQTASELPPLEIRERQIRQSNYIRLDPKESKVIPTMKGGIEDLIITQMGVSSRNELSSQYSVRGGNFDENLVYVNGIEIYRPFLIRSGQQEGLSFVNPDLVSSVLFSAGGFDAKYGDKMSSVLDIQYKKPTEFGASVSASLLGAQGHIEGATKNQRFTYLTGVRYQSNQYILKSLQTKGEYKPSFLDIQSLFSYKISNDWEISFLGNYTSNSYKLVPENRETKFGTINEAYQLRIYFDGQEVDRFQTMMGALSATYNPNEQLNLRFITSTFQTLEKETYDIQGQYWLGRLETSFGNEQFGDAIEAQGVGTYLDHARNFLQAIVMNAEHKGTYTVHNKILQWGLKYQHEIVNDQLHEWEMIDSAGFSIPKPPDTVGNPDPIPPPLLLNNAIRNTIEINSNRYSGFVQNTWEFSGFKYDLSVTGGVRFQYWDFNNQFIASPRGTVAYSPDWKRQNIFRFSAGYYYQPPFYRELRDLHGNINEDIRAQKSIHFVAGYDLEFTAWTRPFKFTTEAYYKILDDLIPYEVDNVRIRYYAENSAHGYAAGVDFKVNGEFVEGVDSWATLSIMRTEEDIDGDYYYDYYNNNGFLITPGIDNKIATDSIRIEPGYIPRPTDQRFNFSLFFQDYIPRNPTYKMHLRILYGSSLPFGAPNTEKYQHTLRIPAYRRVDIGFSKQIIGPNMRKPITKGFFSNFKSIWITLEVFNLLQTNNTVSYLWVTDVNNTSYAVPNYLTPRQLNIRLIASF